MQHALIERLILDDQQRLSALQTLKELNLPDACIAAGFVRNLVWDYYQGHQIATPLNDYDIVYFDPQQPTKERDNVLLKRLQTLSPLPWQVKNQARMHIKNQDNAYQSTTDAMRYWPELETAVGVRLLDTSRLEFISPFPLQQVLSFSATLNPNFKSPCIFHQRVKTKGWLSTWPKLTINY